MNLVIPKDIKKMIRKTLKYFAISLIILYLLSVLISKLIFENKFALETTNLQELEILTSKVFKFTNHNDNPKMKHWLLIRGISSYPFFVHQTAMNYFKFDGYLCGGHSTYLQNIFSENGIKSFTYNHGIENTNYTHMITIAEYNNNLYIFDPTYNFVYRDNAKYLTFKEVINLVKQKKDLRKYIKIINPQDKVFNIKQKKYDNYTPERIVSFFDGGKNLMSKDKDHILLNGFGAYPGTGSMEYFYEKYPYLKSLLQ